MTIEVVNFERLGKTDKIYLIVKDAHMFVLLQGVPKKQIWVF